MEQVLSTVLIQGSSFSAVFAEKDLGVLTAMYQGSADYFTSKEPPQDPVFKDLNHVTTAMVTVGKVAFSSMVQNWLSGKAFPVAEDSRSMGTGTNALLVPFGIAVIANHFLELSKKPAGKDRSAVIIGEVSNVTSYVSRISYSIAVIADEETRQVVIGIMTVSNILSAGLQVAVVAID